MFEIELVFEPVYDKEVKQKKFYGNGLINDEVLVSSGE